jgi:polysaccharide biosynthesis protein PslJ
VTVQSYTRPTTRPEPSVDYAEPSDRGGTVRFLQVYTVLLVLVPPTYIIDPLGAAGTPATVIGVCALLLWMLGVLAPGKYLARTVVPVRVVLGLLIGMILLGYTVLHVRHVPGNELLSSDRMLLQALSWAGVALLAAEGLRDRGELYRLLRTLVVAVAAMAVTGILQFRTGIDLAERISAIPGLTQNADHVTIQERQGFRRPAGTATHPIEFGCVIAMALPLALHLARFDTGRSWFRRWWPVGAIAMGVPVAISRSAVLGAIVAAVVIFVGLEPRVRPRALASAAAFVVAIYATSPGVLGTLRDLFANAGRDSSITYRTNDYDDVAEFVRQSPLIGRGPGTFLPSNYIVLDNQYLMSVIEIGIIGLAIVVGYLLSTAFLGRGARHRTEERSVRDLGQALAATSLASVVTAFTFDAFSFMIFAGFVALSLGMAGALWTTTRTTCAPIAARRSTDGRGPDRPHVSPTASAVELASDNCAGVEPGALMLDGSGSQRPNNDREYEPVGLMAEGQGTETERVTTGDPGMSDVPVGASGDPGTSDGLIDPSPGLDDSGAAEQDTEADSDINAGEDVVVPIVVDIDVGTPPQHITGRVAGHSPNVRRVVVAVGAGLGVVLLGGLAMAAMRAGGDHPDASTFGAPSPTTISTTTTPSTTADDVADAAGPKGPMSGHDRTGTTSMQPSSDPSASSPLTALSSGSPSRAILSQSPTLDTGEAPAPTTAPTTTVASPPATTTTVSPATTTTTAPPPTTTTTEAPPTTTTTTGSSP